MTDSRLADTRLHMVGCGKMGSALLKGWLAAGVSPHNVTIRVASSASADLLSSVYGVTASTTCRYDGEDVVLLAVKPQMLDDVLAENWQPAPQAPLYISVAAGKTLGYFAKKLGDARVIRAMPNTPSLVGKGVTTLVAGANATAADEALATVLFESCGTAITLPNEAQLDIATAVAGSGPAYIFHFAEALSRAAEELGLSADVALALVQGTMGGSVALADAEGWEDLAQLRQNVTSKGGVTHAALQVLMPALTPLLKEALEANIRRSGELS